MKTDRIFVEIDHQRCFEPGMVVRTIDHDYVSVYESGCVFEHDKAMIVNGNAMAIVIAANDPCKCCGAANGDNLSPVTSCCQYYFVLCGGKTVYIHGSDIIPNGR